MDSSRTLTNQATKIDDVATTSRGASVRDMFSSMHAAKRVTNQPSLNFGPNTSFFRENEGLKLITNDSLNQINF